MRSYRSPLAFLFVTFQITRQLLGNTDAFLLPQYHGPKTVRKQSDGSCSYTSFLKAPAFGVLRSKSGNTDSSQSNTETTSGTSKSNTKDLVVPLSTKEMINQVARAISEASKDKKRQIVRILLPRDRSSQDIGVAIEGRDQQDLMLVPPDESWQGGIMQLYYAAAPTAQQILAKVIGNSNGGVPSRILEDRSVDESGVDGVGLLSTEDGKLACWVQPTQENIDQIEEANNDVVILLNPQWRQVDDALDTASKETGFLGNLASFLGGKGGALRRLKEVGYEATYTLEGYVCRGSNVRLLQVLDSEWCVFCERDTIDSYIQVGSFSSRPNYQQVDQCLEQSNIGFKFRRDVGLEPKL